MNEYVLPHKLHSTEPSALLMTLLVSVSPPRSTSGAIGSSARLPNAAIHILFFQPFFINFVLFAHLVERCSERCRPFRNNSRPIPQRRERLRVVRTDNLK